MILWIALAIGVGWIVLLGIFEILVRVERLIGRMKFGVRVQSNAFLKYDSAPVIPKTKKQLIEDENVYFQEECEALDVANLEEGVKEAVKEERMERHAWKIQEILG